MNKWESDKKRQITFLFYCRIMIHIISHKTNLNKNKKWLDTGKKAGKNDFNKKNCEKIKFSIEKEEEEGKRLNLLHFIEVFSKLCMCFVCKKGIYNNLCL